MSKKYNIKQGANHGDQHVEDYGYQIKNMDRSTKKKSIKYKKEKEQTVCQYNQCPFLVSLCMKID